MILHANHGTMKPMTSTSLPPAAATILDVAKLAGVSRTTVSRVLNEPDSVSESLLARVREAAALLNYVPSNAARSLRSGRTGTIALLVGDISQPFHGRLAKAVAQAARARGMSLVLGDLDHSEEVLNEFLSRLPKQGVDGIIIATADNVTSARTRSGIADAISQGVAVVLTMREPSMPNVPALQVDYTEIGRQATARLLADGSSVALMVGQRDANLGRQLVDGYLAAVTDAGGDLVAAASLIVEGGYTFEQSERVVCDLLDHEHPVNGIVVATIPMALGVIHAIEDRGLSVPQDIAVIVCEDVPLAAYTRPGVTTVGVDTDQHGESIVRLLESTIRAEKMSAAPLDIRLTPRQSTR